MTQISEFGAWAENYVAQYLSSKNYVVLDRNYKRKWGEIDLIAEKGGILVFVEVKANSKEISGFEPENRVNPEKLRRLHRAVQTYLASKKHSPNQDWQIDVVSLTLNKERGSVKIRHFKNIDL